MAALVICHFQVKTEVAENHSVECPTEGDATGCRRSSIEVYDKMVLVLT